jgi:hypothetical protein
MPRSERISWRSTWKRTACLDDDRQGTTVVAIVKTPNR